MLGLVQGLTEFLPVSSSGHLMIFRELLGAADTEGFLDFTVAVHFATVLSTIVVFWAAIRDLFKGVFKFTWNDETDYACKLVVSMIPIAIVGVFFKDTVEGMFSGSLKAVGAGLLITSCLLLLSDNFTRWFGKKGSGGGHEEGGPRNGISWLQAFIVGIGQALAVAPGISRSGTTIATGLISGVRRSAMAQFSFLMVLVPIIGEQSLDILKVALGKESFGAGSGSLALVLGFVAAFLAGLAACKAMVALVRRSRLTPFAVYCAFVAILIFILA